MASAAHRTNGGGDTATLDHSQWVDHTRVFLQPIAAPSILGLFGFAGATFMVAAYMAGWYGDTNTPLYLFPFAATFGGIAQFAAGMWAIRARDGLATAMHGMWGAFWIAYGILYLLDAWNPHLADRRVHRARLLVPRACRVTGFGTIAALGENLAITAVLGTLTVGAAFAAVRFLIGGDGWEQAAGWVFLASAFLAAYTAGAMMNASAWGRTILPVGEYRKSANTPVSARLRPLEYELGEPGVKQGQ